MKAVSFRRRATREPALHTQQPASRDSSGSGSGFPTRCEAAVPQRQPALNAVAGRMGQQEVGPSKPSAGMHCAQRPARHSRSSTDLNDGFVRAAFLWVRSKAAQRKALVLQGPVLYKTQPAPSLIRPLLLWLGLLNLSPLCAATDQRSTTASPSSQAIQAASPSSQAVQASRPTSPSSPAVAAPKAASRSSQAALSVEQIRAQLQQPALLRGQFAQQKRLQGFEQSLNSQGHFILARNQGLYWSTDHPFPGVLILTPSRLTQQTDNQPNHQSQTALSAVSPLIFALLAGDLPQLAQEFDIQSLNAERGWRLRLTPKTAALSQVFRQIELSGGQQLQQIQLDASNGDSTRIQFSQQRTEPELTAAEQQYFD